MSTPIPEGDSVKSEVLAMIRRLPNDCTLEDIRYHLDLLEELKLSEEDSEQGRVITNEEARELFQSWFAQ